MDDAAEQALRRRQMVREQLIARGVEDPRVLAAMAVVPRHELVPAAVRDQAYEDMPLPVGHGQTISQPFVVAVMTERAEIRPTSRVLEIGTGSGYQCAVLCSLAAEVYSIEIVPELAREAAASLFRLGYHPQLRVSDGWDGWPEAAPFDAIIVTAAPPLIPPALITQLAPGGHLVIPVGVDSQDLRVVTRDASGISIERVFPVRFVPMTGEAQEGN
jgi:protein-L-isoaspartate(D-aspartate) O-methyltransferase